MKPDLVSIIIVAHNNWPDLELTIQSALHQSYQPLEVIVIDNDSSDLTAQEVPRYFGKHIQYLRQPNVLDGGGYNAGVRMAHGEFIQFIDGDDFIAPNKIEKQVEVFRADPSIDIVFGDVRRFRTCAGVPKWKDVEGRDYADVLGSLICPNGNGAGFLPHSMLYRRRSLEKVGEWDESIRGVDLDYYLRAAWAGCRFKYCPRSLSFYRQRPGQMSADVYAMMRSTETTWAKALTYITQEPYRSTLASCLAKVRFALAVSGDSRTVKESLEKLDQSRSTSRKTISLPAYAIGWALIILPGGRSLVRASRLHNLRARVANLLSLK